MKSSIIFGFVIFCTASGMFAAQQGKVQQTNLLRYQPINARIDIVKWLPTGDVTRLQPVLKQPRLQFIVNAEKSYLDKSNPAQMKSVISEALKRIKSDFWNTPRDGF